MPDEVAVKHPAKFSPAIIDKLGELVPPGVWLDPFAGVGTIAVLEGSVPQRGHVRFEAPRHFVMLELEPEWASQHPKTVCVDALVQMDAWVKAGTRFDGVVTSPVYGNRMSDSHNAQDGSTRHSYTHDLGRKLTEGNIGDAYFWQDRYKEFHIRAWQLAYNVTRPGGEMFLNVSDFYRTTKGERQQMRVVAWHMKTLSAIGYSILKVHRVGTPRMRKGRNGESRVEYEAIIHARRT